MGKNKPEADPQKICALILAAGYSSRMGAFKPILPIGDATAVERVIGSLKNANMERILAVTGYQRELLLPILERAHVKEAYNPDFDSGMFTSIKTGIRHAIKENSAGISENSAGISGFFLMLVDSPLVSPEILKLMAQKHRENPDAFIVPCFRGKKGHPLLIPSVYAEEILAYEGDGGLKAITRRYEDRFIKLEVEDESVVLDMDTPEGYREILDYEERQRSCKADVKTENQWQDALKGRRLFLIRHGQTEQHKEKIFLGQTDIPLSEKGREQAKQAGIKLKECHAITDRIYTSDLARAWETAEIIASILNEAGNLGFEKVRKSAISFVKDKGLREMSLGEWDGCFISQIRERYPEEYEKRGRNLVSYKYGNDSENFYDLQYRVGKCFDGILRLENHEANLLKNRGGTRYPKDIILVAHTGVIKVILSNIYGTSLSKEMEKKIPNGGITMLDFTSTEWQKKGSIR